MSPSIIGCVWGVPPLRRLLGYGYIHYTRKAYKRQHSLQKFSINFHESLSIVGKYDIIITMTKIHQPVSTERAKLMNPIVLAFVGDAVYTLCIREKLALESTEKTGELNRRASEKVSAHGQSEALARILPLLTEEECDIFRRGRNAKKPTKSKNATVGEYVRSTGFEALIGYLYLTGQTERMQQLFFGDLV